MLAIDRWRNWRPSDEKFEDSPGCEPPKPSEPTFEGFEGSTSEQIQNFCESDDPDHDTAAWWQDFNRWRAERCIRREGREDWGGVGYLLVDFAEWCAAHDAVPATRRIFERLLSDAGVEIQNGMARGLVLKLDLEAVLLSQRAPADSETPTCAAIEKRRNARRGKW